MNTSFTPGPWVALPPQADDGYMSNPIGKPDSETMFARAMFTGCAKETADNAKLIAAAPELYAALVAMLAEQNPFMLPELGGGGLPYTAENLTQEAWALRKKQALDQARAALAKVQA